MGGDPQRGRINRRESRTGHPGTGRLAGFPLQRRCRVYEPRRIAAGPPLVKRPRAVLLSCKFNFRYRGQRSSGRQKAARAAGLPCSRRAGQSLSPTAWDLRAVMPRIGAPSSRLPAAQNALYRGKQLGHINGLAQMAVHSSGQDKLPVLLKGVGRHGHNGQAGQLRVV